MHGVWFGIRVLRIPVDPSKIRKPRYEDRVVLRSMLDTTSKYYYYGGLVNNAECKEGRDEWNTRLLIVYSE